MCAQISTATSATSPSLEDLVQGVLPGMPRLAIYMGHVSIVSTAHYLHFLPAMRQLASERFEAAFGDVVQEAPA